MSFGFHKVVCLVAFAVVLVLLVSLLAWNSCLGGGLVARILVVLCKGLPLPVTKVVLLFLLEELMLYIGIVVAF